MGAPRSARTFVSPSSVGRLSYLSYRGMLPTAGIAPARPFGHSVLNTARLLFHHAGMLVRPEGFAPSHTVGVEPTVVGLEDRLPVHRRGECWSGNRESNPTAASLATIPHTMCIRMLVAHLRNARRPFGYQPNARTSVLVSRIGLGGWCCPSYLRVPSSAVCC